MVWCRAKSARGAVVSCVELAVKVEKLTEHNFYVWKQKVELILAYREVDHVVSERNPHDEGSGEYKEWVQSDKVARAVIGLSLSDDMLEHIRGLQTAKEMLERIVAVFQRHTLLNKLRARREFYTATMNPNEKILTYITRIRHLSTILKSMGVQVDDEEVAMAVLNGLPTTYGNIITALDALGDDSKFTLEFVKSRLLQEEQRNNMRTDIVKAEAAFLHRPQYRNRNTQKCHHCGRKGHTEDRCWDKHPEQRPDRMKLKTTSPTTRALAADESAKDNADEREQVLCLMTVGQVSNSNPISSTKVQRSCKNLTWFIDSGASSHMTGDRDVFTTYEDVEPLSVKIGDNSELKVLGRGDIEVTVGQHGCRQRFILQNVLHVPTLKYSLLSVGVLIGRGLHVGFDRNGVSVKNNDREILYGAKDGKMFSLHTTSQMSATEFACVASLNLWHKRLGHAFPDGTLRMSRHNVVEGLQVSSKQMSTCDACTMGKLTRTDIPKTSTSRHYDTLDVVYTDVCGPMRVESMSGCRYYVLFIDAASKWMVVYPIRAKSHVLERFKRYIQLVERQTSRKLKSIHSDNGGEYNSNDFLAFLEQRWIEYRRTCAYTPHQNGTAERMNRTLMNMVRSMLHQSKLQKRFWADAVVTATYIRNRITCRGFPRNTTPYEKWYGSKPNVAHMRVFGSRCWYSRHGEHGRKLDTRAREATMIRHDPNRLADKLWDPALQKTAISRDVKFEKDDYPKGVDNIETPLDQDACVDVES